MVRILAFIRQFDGGRMTHLSYLQWKLGPLGKRRGGGDGDLGMEMGHTEFGFVCGVV